ncbi:MAG: translation initiation factor IF-2 [Proteobacteria bacterium]|nr:translation initiation factor IF-2 [Pseudomonadota bacterium]MBU1685980.1 translation initiation factor IF-2 [Pseudomonadota bacterium]
MANKVRVYTLAKEAGIDSKELTAKLVEMGYDVSSHSSSMDEDMADEVRRRLGLIETTTERTRIQSKGRTTIIRRRVKKVVSDSGEEIDDGAEPMDEDEGGATEIKSEAIFDASDIASGETLAEEPIISELEQTTVSDALPAVAVSEGPTQGAVEEKRGGEPSVESSPEELIDQESDREPEVKIETAETGVQEPLAAEPPAVEAVVVSPRHEVVRSRPGIAKVIKRGAIILPVEEPKIARPKKIEKKGKVPPVKAAKSEDKVSVDESGDAGKGKKGKRYVKFTNDPAVRDRTKKVAKRKGQVDVDMEDVGAFGGRLSSNVRMGRVRRGGSKKSKMHGELIAETKAIKKRIKVFETISVGDLSHRMGVKGSELIAVLINLGVMATLNQALDVETATLVAAEFGYEVEQGETEEQTVINLEESYSGGEEVSRPPVVTVMGHVDHGKTSILDAIRATDVAAGEAGGITQHIGAHFVRSAKGDVVFLDTPGHAAFTEMRSRGAKVTDVVVLVVAADDGVMDQTREAINHARAAGVPIVVAINKIDKPDANSDRVKAELAEFDLTPEEWGGQTIFCETSAKQNLGIEELLEQILLQAEILELKSNPNRKAKGWVVEAQLHKGRGPVATILVQHGTLRVGDSFVVGEHYGRVRSMHNDKGEIIQEATPATPVEVHGLSGVPRAGDEFIVVPDEKTAKNISSQRQMKTRESELATTTKISLENLFSHLEEGESKELRVLLRSDVQGTLEAFRTAIENLSTDEVKVRILHQGTGAIVESDILLASASDALIFGFNVRPDAKARELAKTETVDIRFYDVIYHALDDIEKAMTGLLEPTFREQSIGAAEVRDIFHHPKAGTIAGCYVVEGRIERSAKLRVVRNGVVLFTGKLASLRRFKDDVKEVATGFECGIGVENYNDIKIGDVLEVFVMEEVAGVL